MFFVNGDLHAKNEAKSLSEVINDNNSKVAYGVLSLKSFYGMVKQIGGNERVFIPKVQRGLVWKDSDKSTFIKNCIIGREGGIKEPMPNIFLFYDVNTKELQLFDGLQRTSAIIDKFKSIDNIESSDNVMIPTALFKGGRIEAEELFRNINEKGIKLSDFEKLASQGGEYEIELSKIDKNISEDFSEFVKDLSKRYSKKGLSTSKNEKSTLYELLVYTIYKFSNTPSAKEIFESKGTQRISEWGYQIIYSTMTTKESKKYASSNMLDSTMDDFSKLVDYSKDSNNFSKEKLEEYINKINSAIVKAQVAIKDIYQRNINSKNEQSICKKALKSRALVGSLVIVYFLYPDVEREMIEMWFLKQLVDGVASSNTNTIVDDLIKFAKDADLDIESYLKKSIKSKIEYLKPKSHNNWLWHLFCLQRQMITNYKISTEFDIDHIVPQQKLKKVYEGDEKKKEKINDIANLAIVTRKWNKAKSSHLLTAMPEKKLKDFNKDQIIDFYSFGDKDDMEIIMASIKSFELAFNNNNYSLAKQHYETFLSTRKAIIEKQL